MGPGTDINTEIDIDAVPEAFRPFAAPLLGREDGPERLVELLGTLGEKAGKRQAAAFALLLRKALPRDARTWRVTEVFLRRRYPAWYIAAVNDAHRNAAYRAAIEAAVGPDSVVLELGTGSGLFAMNAARAGAAQVYSCELDDAVRAIAGEIVRRNGLADRITLLGDYRKIAPGTLPRPADVLIHEFVGPEYLTEGMGTLLAGLREECLAPNAAILPRWIGVRAMLVSDRGLLAGIRVDGPVEGFDLAPINLLAGAQQARRGPVETAPLSAPFTVLEHDLAGDAPPARETALAIEPLTDGTAIGLLQWIRHRFPGGAVYENTPDRACNWLPVFWPFAEAVPVRAGRPLTVRCRTTETELFFDPLP